ncbi:hypothetical protein CPT_Machias_275 [Staphylococcus phage Machias]|nr:hypothetical protein CPT_Machias_275 [Staphylococcus phage Machias]
MLLGIYVIILFWIGIISLSFSISEISFLFISIFNKTFREDIKIDLIKIVLSLSLTFIIYWHLTSF